MRMILKLMSAKFVLRNSIASILFTMRLTAPARRSCGHLSVVTFHRVLPEADRLNYPFPDLVVTPEELDSLLIYFTEYFDCGALMTQHERYLSGEITLRPLLAITFDDAQYDNYHYARSVLAQHQVRASFFVPVMAVERKELLWHDRLGFAILMLLKNVPDGRERLMHILAAAGLSVSGQHSLIGNIVEASKALTLATRLRLIEELVQASGEAQSPEFARLMTFAEIADLAADGHEIGSHSMTHCLMPECDDEALFYEVLESRRVLHDRLGLPIETFCYPNGNSDERAAKAVVNAGYRRAVTTTPGRNGRDGDCFQLHRYNMVAKRVQDSNGKFIPALLAFRMSGLYPGLGC